MISYSVLHLIRETTNPLSESLAFFSRIASAASRTLSSLRIAGSFEQDKQELSTSEGARARTVAGTYRPLFFVAQPAGLDLW